MSTQPPPNPNEGQPNTTGEPKVAPPAPNPQLAELQQKVGDLEKSLEKEAAMRRVRQISFWSIAVVLVVLWLLAWLRFHCGWWSHLLLVLALVAVLLESLSRGGNSKNIDAQDKHIPNWNPADPEVSLTQIYIYVLDEAAKSIKWYWKNKGSKAMLSRIIRFVVWALAAVGGLLPIIGVLLQDFSDVDLTNGLWASLLLGIAAALLGLDKGFGFSSGWARYVLTATNIRKTLEEFRLDWTVLRAKTGNNLTAENVAPLIERAKQFRSDVEGLVLQETKDWVTEFQSTMQQMEKDVAAQLSALKTQMEKAKEEAGKQGYIQLTVEDPQNKAAGKTLKITVIDSGNKEVITDDPITPPTWSRFIAPGLYRFAVKLDNAPIAAPDPVTVKSGEGAPAKLTIR